MLAVAAAALLASPPALAAQEVGERDGGQLVGRVTSESGEPVSGATVLAAGPGVPGLRRAQTGTRGEYRLGSLPAGSYTVTVRAYGYAEWSRSVDVAAGRSRHLEVSLRPAPVQLRDVEVTTATRTLSPVGRVPAAVTVVDREGIEDQAAFTSDIGQILDQTVPGLAPGNQSSSNFGQTLRGRDLHVMVDGIPVSTPLRDGQRALHSVDPSAIERVEIVRGATAAYGHGGTGGVMNIITRQPGDRRRNVETEVQITTPGTEFGEDLGSRLTQNVSGRVGDVGYTVGATVEQTANRYDAEGDRIPPNPRGQGGRADATGVNLHGKVGVPLGDDHEITLSATRYEFQQDDDLGRLVPGTVGEQKTTVDPGEESRSEDVGNEHTAAHARYRASDLFLGSDVEVTAFLDRFTARFPYSGFFGAQSRIESDKEGARAHVSTPVGILPGAALTWGADYLRDETAQPLSDGRVFAPPIEQQSIGPFARLKLPVESRLTLRGGVRHEEIWLDVDDFTTIEEVGGNPVEGGDLSYSATVADVGAVFALTSRVDLFASFSQGFSVTEVGRQLRGTTAESVEALQPDPKESDHYEAGLRGRWSGLHVTASVYENTSELGTTFDEDLRIVRSPEEIRGVELSLDGRPSESWKLGGTFTWTAGLHDADDDGDVDDPLPGSRIPPVKGTAYLENVTLPGWRNRIQVQSLGDREVFPEDASAFGRGNVDGYTTVDVSSALDLWRGTVRLGVQNVLNEFYFPPASQWFNVGSGYTAGTGRSVSLTYSIGWR